MVSFQFTVKDQKGIHARPAGEIAAVAKQFKSDCYIIHDGDQYDLKKLLTFIGSQLKYKDTIEVITDGSDEKEALKALQDSFNQNL